MKIIRGVALHVLGGVILFQMMLPPESGAANKIMPLGDSITQGALSGVDDEAFQVSYRKTLYSMLKANGYVFDNELFVGTLFSGEAVQDFDPDHEGHYGWRADEIVAGRTGSSEGTLSDWLISEAPDIILLHIGTNDIREANEDWREVEDILKVVDEYELMSGNVVWVVLSLIIDVSCDPYLPPCPKSAETTAFNDSIRDNVFVPRKADGDKILLVDMQHDAGIDYERWESGGDMWDDLHPHETGYAKMANLWYSALLHILPQADAGAPQTVNEAAVVTLNGSNSTDEGAIASCLWEQVSGISVVITDASTETATFKAPEVDLLEETMVFKLTVTDDDGFKSMDTVNITVKDLGANNDEGGDKGGGGCFLKSINP